MTEDALALVEIEKAVEELEIADPLVRNNVIFWRLHNDTDGVLKKLSRRQWIERYVKIKNKRGKIVPLILNEAQRKFESIILRAERAGIPVRIRILKARQMGFSTYVVALMFERAMRSANFRSLLIANRNDTTKLFLKMAERMREGLLKGSGDAASPWEFKYKSKSRFFVHLSHPFQTEMEVTSAEVDEPGHGDTCQCLHMSEGSRWPDADLKQKGVVNALPTEPRTYGFDESTANGDVGAFRDNFWDAYNENHIGLASYRRQSPWIGFFAPWFWHQEYRYTKTYGAGREMPQELIDAILENPDEEERWLLKQRYRCRFKGETFVDVDQLAWRRLKIREHASITDFNEQFPSRPDVAFAASGNPAYNPDRVREMLEYAKDNPPVWVGDPVEAA